MDKKNYTLSDVETSLNYGKPLSKTRRGFITVMWVIMCIMAVVLVVAAVIACVLVDASERKELWVFAPACVIVLFVIIIMSWMRSICDRNEKQIEDCFDDAIETKARIRYEPYVFNDGSHVLTYVVYFTSDGTDYAVALNNSFNAVTGNKRKDLDRFVNATCSILYSPKHNDVLILKIKPNLTEEII